MKKRYLALISIIIATIIFVGGLLATQAAGTCDGTTGDDVIDCTTSPTGADTQVDGDLGNDTITVGQNVTTTFIDADGQSGAADLPGAGNGGDDTIVNNGTVTIAISGDYATGVGGNDNITNNGTAGTIYGDEAAGTVTSSGDDTITNNGTTGNIIADDNATAGGNDVVVNNGTVTGTIDAGGGDDNITNTNSVGDIDAGNGNNVVTNSGTVNGDVVSGVGSDNITNDGDVTGNIDTGDGNNVVTNSATVIGNVVSGTGSDNVTNSGDVTGNIDTGDGNDTVTIDDTSSVGGTINGGTGTDVLQFTFNDPAAAAAAAVILAQQSPAGGTVTIGGQTYTWVNFEQLKAILLATVGQSVSIKVRMIKDGRLNAYDLGAPIAIYCVPDEYVQVIDIHQDGINPLAFRTNFKSINNAVAQAKAEFNFASIDSGEGDYLSAMMDGSLVAYGPTFDASKIYRFTFNPDCTYTGIGTES
jgi:hypothetical protein